MKDILFHKHSMKNMHFEGDGRSRSALQRASAVGSLVIKCDDISAVAAVVPNGAKWGRSLAGVQHTVGRREVITRLGVKGEGEWE